MHSTPIPIGWLRRALARLALIWVVCSLPVSIAATAQQPDSLVHFRLRDNYLIIVPVVVNGSGPYDFLLDTGATHSVIDPSLARQLQAPIIGRDRMVRISEVRQDVIVRLDEMRLGEVAIAGMETVVDKLELAKSLVPGVRGVVGGDFLARFDILIDYERRSLSFDEPAPEGERCRFEARGQYHGIPTSNRLLVKVAFPEIGSGEVSLQLDTGARLAELFPASHVSYPPGLWLKDPDGRGDGPNRIVLHPRMTIKIGATEVRNLDVAQAFQEVPSDAVGLLPAAIFRRIYISHSGGYLVLNPREVTREPNRGTGELAVLEPR